MTLVRDDMIAHKYIIQEMDKGGMDDCQVCLGQKRFTRKVLTNYGHTTEDTPIDSHFTRLVAEDRSEVLSKTESVELQNEITQAENL